MAKKLIKQYSLKVVELFLDTLLTKIKRTKQQLLTSTPLSHNHKKRRKLPTSISMTNLKHPRARISTIPHETQACPRTGITGVLPVSR
jgi:hypothetical protein